MLFSCYCLLLLLLLSQINTIVQCWVSEHFSDFEGQDEMEEFLDWFEHKLVEDVSGTHTRALNSYALFYLTPASL